MCHNLFNQSPIEDHLGCLQFGAISNKSTVNICEELLCEYRFHFSGINNQEFVLLGCVVVASLVL